MSRLNLIERMVEIADRDDTTGLASDALREGSEQLEAMQAEVKRLRGLVQRAYVEGHNHGRANPPVYQHSSEDWETSRSRASLSNPQVSK